MAKVRIMDRIRPQMDSSGLLVVERLLVLVVVIVYDILIGQLGIE